MKKLKPVEMDLNEAIDIVFEALQCYSEDCISEDHHAQRELQEAWYKIEDLLERKRNA